MGSRIPPRTREELSSKEQDEYDHFTQKTESGFGKSGEQFVYKEDNGAFVGPFPFIQAAPDTGKLVMELIFSVGSLPMPADAKETAILVVGAHHQAAYELYAHVNVATKREVLSDQQATLIAQGQKPIDLNSKCSLAYDFAKTLLKPGPLPQNLWDQSVDAFGKDGTVALVHYIGLYAYVSIALNAVDAPVPRE